jgi:hypothetical protein
VDDQLVALCIQPQRRRAAGSYGVAPGGGEGCDRIVGGGVHGPCGHRVAAGGDTHSAHDRDDQYRYQQLRQRSALPQFRHQCLLEFIRLLSGGTIVLRLAGSSSLFRIPYPEFTRMPLTDVLRPRARFLRLAVILSAVLVAGCIGGLSPQAELDAAQGMLELSDALAAIREEQAILQDEVDSLMRTVARQDSLIRRLADFTGAPLPR